MRRKRLITVPLAHDDATNGGWRIDFDALEAAVTPDTRVFLFCNPHNPVGRVYSRDDVERVAGPSACVTTCFSFRTKSIATSCWTPLGRRIFPPRGSTARSATG